MAYRTRFAAASLGSALMISGLATSATAQERNKTPAADWMTQRPATFSVVMQIERGAGRGERMIDARMAAAVCESTAVVDPVILTATGLPLAEARQLVLVEAEASNESFVTLKVTLSPAATQRLKEGVGPTVLRELANRATAVLTKSAELQMAPLLEQRAQLEKRVQEAEAQFAEIDARYKTAAGRVEPANNGRYNQRPDLERQRFQIAQQMAGTRARLGALEANRPATQPTVARPEIPANQLASQLIELRQRALATTKEAIAAGKASEADLIAAQERVVEAQLLAAMAEASPRPRGADRGGESTADNISILRGMLAEQEAQLAAIEAQLATLPAPTTAPSDLMSQNDFQALNNDRQEARNRAQNARQQRDAFEQQYGNLKPPTITPLKLD